MLIVLYIYILPPYSLGPSQHCDHCDLTVHLISIQNIFLLIYHSIQTHFQASSIVHWCVGKMEYACNRCQLICANRTICMQIWKSCSNHSAISNHFICAILDSFQWL